VSRVVDSQTHWYPRLLWDAYTERTEYPRCRREGDGYLFELAPDKWFPIRPHFYELEQQLEAFEAAGIDAVISSSASFGDVDGLHPSAQRRLPTRSTRRAPTPSASTRDASTASRRSRGGKLALPSRCWTTRCGGSGCAAS
jgi:hypothetical protein